MGQTAHNLTCSIMEKPHAGLEECLIILLSCFRARNSAADDDEDDDDPLASLTENRRGILRQDVIGKASL